MPISQEQARAYAQRFCDDEPFRRALRNAQHQMVIQGTSNVAIRLQPDTPLPYFTPDSEVPIARLVTQHLQFSREDLNRINQALVESAETMAQRPQIFDDPIDVYRHRTAGLMTRLSTERLINGLRAELTTTPTSTDQLYRELLSWTDTRPQNENSNSTEAPTMRLAIPHPLADFDDDTQFYWVDHMGQNGYFAPVSAGEPTYDLRLSARRALRHTPENHDRALVTPDQSSDSFLTLTCMSPYYIGLPLSKDTPETPNEMTLFAHPTFDQAAIIEPGGVLEDAPTMVFPTNPNTRAWYYDDRTTVLAQLDRPIEQFRAYQTPVHSLKDAWEQCSESWRNWAQARCQIPLPHLMWHTLIAFPNVFGIRTVDEFYTLWGERAIGRISMRLALSAPIFNPGDKTLSIYRNGKDMIADKRTTLRAGKAVRHMLPETSDSTVKSITSEIVGQLTPPDFRIGFTKADFDQAYTNGPSSCMTYSQERYYLLRHLENDIRPTDAYVNGDIGIATITAGDKVTARALIVNSTKKYVRIYAADYANSRNGADVLHEHLEAQGYSRDERALVGQKLLKIPLEMPREDLLGRANGAFGLSRNVLMNCGPMATVINRLGEGILDRLIDTLNPRAFVAPYVDHGGYPVVERDDGLEITAHQDYVTTYVNCNLNTCLDTGDGRLQDGVGRPHYEAGGVIVADLASAARLIRELEQEVRAPQEQPTTPDPLAVPPRPRAPLHPNSRAEALNAEAERVLEQYPASDPFTTLRPLYNNWSLVVTDIQLTDDQAQELGDVLDTRFELVDSPDGVRVWCDEDEISTDNDGNTFISDHASAYGLVWCEHESEWYDVEDTVTLEDTGECVPEDASYVVYIDDRGYYDEDSSQICYVDRENGYYHVDDCVNCEDGEWELASQCYELPNGDYIHQDDLTRVA